MDIHSGSVVFFMIGHTVCDVFDVGVFNDMGEATSIQVPLEAEWHRSPYIYAHLRELKELIAHPDSPVYETFDGALCRRTGSIEYIPRGKTSLHIHKTTQKFGYGALWTCDHLDTITVDPDSPYFTVMGGSLFSKDMTRLVFVPRTVKTLILPEALEYIDRDAIAFMAPETIEIAPENTRFSLKDGALYQGSELIYLQPHVKELHLGSDVLSIRCSLDPVRSITADPLNPQYMTVDNCLFDKTGTRLLYRGCDQDTLTVFLHTEIPKGFMKYSSGKPCMIHVIVPDGSRLSFLGNPRELRSYLNIIRNHLRDVKAGTEYLFLEMYLTGWSSDEAFLRSFKLSTAQILRRIVTDNNLGAMEKIILNGTIMTEKHMSRSIRQAELEDKLDMHILLLFYKLSSELGWL